MADNTSKIYYSISEVAKIIGVSEPTLRFWETEFPHIRPRTTANRVRQYTTKEIDDIKLVYNLIKVRGFKIAAARKMLHANRKEVENTDKIMQKLQNVRDQLVALKEQMDIIV